MAIDTTEIVEGIKDQIKDHLEAQPYDVKCYQCNSVLGVATTETDGDMDLYIKIEPCQTCIDSAVEEAKEE